jgi:hypothetical protein
LSERLIDVEPETGIQDGLTCDEKHDVVGAVGIKIGEDSEFVKEGAMEQMSFIEDEDWGDFAVLREVDETLPDLADDVDFEEGWDDIEGEGNRLIEFDRGTSGLWDIGWEELGFAEVIDEGSDEGGFASARRSGEGGDATTIRNVSQASQGLIELRIREVVVGFDLGGEGDGGEAKEALKLGKGQAHQILLLDRHHQG